MVVNLTLENEHHDSVCGHKTIEERAKEYADLCVVGDCSGLSGLIHSVAEKAYFAGGHEQKVIDDDHLREAKKMVIDKACDAFCKARCPLQYEMCEKGQWKKDCLAFFNFKKAMEE